MFDYAYLIEILTPKCTVRHKAKDEMNLFAERYYRAIDLGMGISVPDNPMGQPRFSLVEMIEQFDLPVNGEKTVMNLNTFHTINELNELLNKASSIGVKYLLVVRGDGGPQLSRLDPKTIGGVKNIATSIDLLHYINTAFKGRFMTGCAYNHYNSMPFESDRLKEKIEAGAKFIISQPVVGKDSNIDAILNIGLPVVVEAWMSKNVELLFKSVRKIKDENAKEYDPVVNLQTLHDIYFENCIYLSMLGFKKQWKSILPRI